MYSSSFSSQLYPTHLLCRKIGTLREISECGKTLFVAENNLVNNYFKDMALCQLKRI